MSDLITGIQQVGIGVASAEEAKIVYRNMFRMEALVFEDHAAATLMTKYTGDKIHHRHAILSMNLAGGGGFEIWQFTSRPPVHNPSIRFGDTGIFAPKIKSQHIDKAYEFYSNLKGISVSAKQSGHFWIKDKYDNHFQIIESNEWFHSNNHICGGVGGAVIGVTNMDNAIEFYSKVLGLDEMLQDSIIKADTFLSGNSNDEYRSVTLAKKKNPEGAFSKLLGDINIELIQPINKIPDKIFKDRFWGDCGFIHLCFDVLDMDKLKKWSHTCGHPFTVDSQNSYAMESSAGRFCYLEDPDGTLIELVETHKVPIFKKIGWHLNLKKRKKNTPLPDWMIKMIGLNKVK